MTSRAWTVDALDLRVAERLCRLAGTDDPAMVTLTALAASAPRGGHVCVDLSAVDGPVEVRLPAHDGGYDRPDPTPLAPLGDVEELLARVVRSSLARRGDDAGPTTPVVVDGQRVYLDRYWGYEDRLHDELVTRSAGALLPQGDHAAAHGGPAAAADQITIRSVLDSVAPHDPTGPAVDRQRLAVANGLLRPLSVLSGGPGTGKTHTVVSLLVAHTLLAEALGRSAPRMAIAAPTGKAAARLEQAISEAVTERDLPEDAARVVAGLRGRTIHRLLGYQRWTPTRFRHDAAHPLPYDVVVVDEASMVPLSLMAKLVEAVRRDAVLVLVGDRHQLTSVEAGAVLGDICGPQATGSSLRLSERWGAALAAVTGEPVGEAADTVSQPGVWDGIVQLERFRRFGADTGIGVVARAIQAIPDDEADVATRSVIGHLTADKVEQGAAVVAYDDVELFSPEEGSALPRRLESVVAAAFDPYLDAVLAGDAEAALTAIDALRVLCAVRSGPHGVRAVGELVERWVVDRAHATRPDDARRIDSSAEWYEGRPVLVTRNDHDLGVMNGDVGVTLVREGRTLVAFRFADGQIRAVPAVRVADCETVWAMTIHKSQGSQFGHTVVVLPDRESRVVSRELVYTGVTRARDRLTVVADESVLAIALRRPVRRATGLSDRLWGGQP